MVVSPAGSARPVRSVQFLNALASIVFSLAGSVRSVRDVQPLKASMPMSPTLSQISTVRRLVSPAQQYLGMEVTVPVTRRVWMPLAELCQG